MIDIKYQSYRTVFYDIRDQRMISYYSINLTDMRSAVSTDDVYDVLWIL